jgi:hypothetical protein
MCTFGNFQNQSVRALRISQKIISSFRKMRNLINDFSNFAIFENFSLKARALYCDCSEWQEVIPMVWKIRVRLINIVPFKMLIGLI